MKLSTYVMVNQSILFRIILLKKEESNRLIFDILVLLFSHVKDFITNYEYFGRSKY